MHSFDLRKSLVGFSFGMSLLLTAILIANYVYKHGVLAGYVFANMKSGAPDFSYGIDWNMQDFLYYGFFGAIVLISCYGLIIDSVWVLVKGNFVHDRKEMDKAFWHMLGWLIIANLSIIALTLR